MDIAQQNSAQTPDVGSSEQFATGWDGKVDAKVLPVIVQPVVPETTGSIPSETAANILRPDEGTIRVIDIASLGELNFNFPPSAVRIAALDVDIVMVFNDNSKLILPNLALGLLGANPPKLKFLGKSISPQAMMSAISDVTLADASPSIHFASSDFVPKKPSGPTDGAEKNATGKEGLSEGEAPQTEQQISSGGKNDSQFDFTGSKDVNFGTTPLKDVNPNPVVLQTSSVGVISPSVVQQVPKINSFATEALVTGQLYQSVGVTTSGNQIKGATGTGDADQNSDYSVQTTPEVLTGSSKDDEIWGEDPSRYTQGMAGRSVQITLPDKSFIMQTVLIAGVPDSIKILNAFYVGNGTYIMELGPGNSFTMKLAYTLPSEGVGKDSDGYYNNFRYEFEFTFSGLNSKGQSGTVKASATIGIRDVNSSADQIGSNPITGQLAIGLPRDPTGNIINAGDGNDIIHGAAGADAIDGGLGRDRVVYDLSNSGVSVNLSTGKGDKGFARGDTYTGIEDVVGSAFNDTLIGDDQDNFLSAGSGNDSLFGGRGRNTLIGGEGADTLDGTDGTIDLVDYSASRSGVSVNLYEGTGSGGDAAGDRLINIEAIIGSQSDDYFVAGSSSASIFAGGGNDSIEAGLTTGSTLDGGDGLNTLSYALSNAGITASLTDGSDSKNNVIRNFGNITGSGKDDSLTGDQNNNELKGGAGNDSLRGAGGNDTLDGGDGNDTLIGGLGNDTLDGGDGTGDTADYSYSTANRGITLTLNGTVPISVTVNTTGDTDRLVNIEHVVGTDYNDNITGDGNANRLSGGAGDDTLSGGAGSAADSLYGGSGNDSLRLDWNSIGYRIDGGDGFDRLGFSGSPNSKSFSGSSFSDLLSNVEYIDFSNTSGLASLSLGGDDVQKILKGSTQSSDAGTLELKFDLNDKFTLLANDGYSYWNSNDINATTGKIDAGTTYSIDGSTNSYVYVFDANHTTLLATLYFHT